MNIMNWRFKLILTALIISLLAISYLNIKSSPIKIFKPSSTLLKPSNPITNQIKLKSMLLKKEQNGSVSVTSSPINNQLHTLVPKSMTVIGTSHDKILAKNIITGNKLISATPPLKLIKVSSPSPSLSPSPIDKASELTVMGEDKILVEDESFMINKKIYRSNESDDNIDDVQTGLDSTLEDDILNKDDLIYSMNKKLKSASHATKLYSGLKEPLILPWFILLALLVVLALLLKFVSKPKL